MKVERRDLINNDGALITDGVYTTMQTEHMFGYSVYFNLAGAGTGTFTIEGSNDGVNWFTITGQSLAKGGGVVTQLYEKSDMYHPFIRLNVSAIAGAVTGTAWFMGKGA